MNNLKQFIVAIDQRQKILISIQKIIRVGNPSLNLTAERVRDFNTDWLNRLIIDLFDTMMHVGGLGIASTQVNVNVRVFVMGPNKQNPDFPKLAIINPEFTSNDTLIKNWESCLSIPKMKGEVMRYNEIRSRVSWGITSSFFCLFDNYFKYNSQCTSFNFCDNILF